MYLSLLYRGPGRYVVLDGRNPVGSLEGATLRFGPFESEADAERAAAAGRAALRRWLESRSGARLAEHRDATIAPSGRAEAAPARSELIEFMLPPDIYPAVALDVAQRILAAIRGSVLDPHTGGAVGATLVA
jgi:hypothetical protein